MLRRSRRAQSRASASEKSVDCAAAASSTAFGISSSSLSRRDNTPVLRCSFSNQPDSPTRPPRSISAVKRALPGVFTPRRPLTTRYTPSAVDPDSNSQLPAGNEKCTAPAARASRVLASNSARSAQSRRQSMARRSSCAPLDCSSSSAIRQLAAGHRGIFSPGDVMTPSISTVVFSHGKESGPWGSKITAMAAVVRGLNIAVESIDYRGLDDPADRVHKLVGIAKGVRRAGGPGGLEHGGPRVGGRGGHAAAARPVPAGAGFLHGRLRAIHAQDVACPTAIVHGWHDVIVPVENSIRWAREHHATLHILDSDHRLEDQIGAICGMLLRASWPRSADAPTAAGPASAPRWPAAPGPRWARPIAPAPAHADFRRAARRSGGPWRRSRRPRRRYRQTT